MRVLEGMIHNMILLLLEPISHMLSNSYREHLTEDLLGYRSEVCLIGMVSVR